MFIASDIISVTVTSGLISNIYTIDADSRSVSDFDTLADVARRVIGIYFDKTAGHVKGALDLGFTVTAKMWIGTTQHDITEQFMRAGWKSYGFEVVEPVADTKVAELITADEVAAVSAIMTLTNLNFDTFGQSHRLFSSEILAATELRARTDGVWFAPAQRVDADLNAITAAVQTAAFAFCNEDATIYEEHPIDGLREAMIAFRRLIYRRENITASRGGL